MKKIVLSCDICYSEINNGEKFYEYSYHEKFHNSSPYTNLFTDGLQYNYAEAPKTICIKCIEKYKKCLESVK